MLSLTAQVRQIVAGFGAQTGNHTIFCDLSGAMIAPGEVIALLFSTMTNPLYAHLRARRIAFYAPGALSRLQIDRLRAARPGIDVFQDKSDAIRWLDEKVVAVAA